MNWNFSFCFNVILKTILYSNTIIGAVPIIAPPVDLSSALMEKKAEINLKEI